jgi:hypothetical protein
VVKAATSGASAVTASWLTGAVVAGSALLMGAFVL